MPFGIEKSGEKWTVVNKHTGRVLGTHGTEDEAKKQLAAVQINYKKESMNESNELIMKLHYEKKIDLGALESFWMEAVSRQENYGKTPEEKDRSNPRFWKGVKQYFQKLVDSVDVQEAKEIIMNREQFKETSSEYLDALQSDNYVKAKELFPKIVDAKLKAMINNRGKAFLQQMNKQQKDTPKK
jgi:hypothetical protein